MAEETTEEEEPKKKKPVLLIIIAVNVLLGGGAAAFFFLRSAPPPPPAGEHGEHGEEAHAEPEHDKPSREARPTGPVVQFEPIIVNLNEPEGTRFLKIALAVQLANEKLTTPVDEAKPIIRDHFIRELSDLNYRQTAGNKNKLAIKRRLVKRFNEALGTEGAVEIHITEFIVQ
ncbi:MAG: hypothetical protein B7733_09545 [Myxococcales bacterium FL481]|nr:MAG: hypothetical protein B7733_09545 [Myxococcales bacterium FL481]